MKVIRDPHGRALCAVNPHGDLNAEEEADWSRFVGALPRLVDVVERASVDIVEVGQMRGLTKRLMRETHRLVRPPKPVPSVRGGR